MVQSVSRMDPSIQPASQAGASAGVPAREPGPAAHLPLVGTSPQFRKMLDLAAKMACWSVPVLIEGETGTGKELVARAIHYVGTRSAMSFVPVNCGALPDALVENELFGHQRGAYTGATESHVGLVSQARGGTLFLDEVDTLSPKAQVSLLRFLQDSRFRPLGGRKEDCSDVRVIAACNADLDRLVSEGLFRADLLFRLRVLSLQVPPLRERREDIVTLARHFLRRFSLQYGKPEKTLHPDMCAWMLNYDWPGNVRELENLIHREFLLCEDRQLYVAGPASGPRPAAMDEPGKKGQYGERGRMPMAAAKAKVVEQFERAYLTELMAQAGGNVSLAARIAGKERRSLGRLLKKHGLSPR